MSYYFKPCEGIVLNIITLGKDHFDPTYLWLLNKLGPNSKAFNKLPKKLFSSILRILTITKISVFVNYYLIIYLKRHFTM